MIKIIKIKLDSKQGLIINHYQIDYDLSNHDQTDHTQIDQSQSDHDKIEQD